ncbi:MAG: HD domain-containing protein [Lachnospiraceae bacterium]|nr:HD domain-containing protein [Lachnospiraceae bacterium]
MSMRLEAVIQELEEKGRLGKEREHLQHGTTTVFEHSVHVAYVSLRFAEKFHIRVDTLALLRGALLHDYFLYDWHRPNHGHGLHGFTHPRTALENASKDFVLTEIEKNIIARHMFPLTFLPPTCREAWIVCLADKYCALQETLFTAG